MQKKRYVIIYNYNILFICYCALCDELGAYWILNLKLGTYQASILSLNYIPALFIIYPISSLRQGFDISPVLAWDIPCIPDKS